MVGVLIALGILCFLLWIPIRFCFSFSEELKLTVWIAFLPIGILPKKESKRPSQPKKEPKKTKEKSQQNFFSSAVQERGLKGFLLFLLELLKIGSKLVGQIGSHLVAECCEADLVIGKTEAADTAEQYGKACAVIYPIWGQLISLTRCRRHRLQIQPDFLSCAQKIACKIRFRIRIFWILRAGLNGLRSFLVLAFKEKMQHTKQNA